MEQEEGLVRYSEADIKRLLAEGKGGSDWDRINAMTEEEIREAIASDPDSAFDPDPKDWDAVTVEITPPKSPLYMRLDADVLHWFKKRGKGYQSRINAVLRSYVHAQERRQGDAQL